MEAQGQVPTVKPGTKYQKMPPHTPAERALVKAAIERDRIVEPVVVDEEGNIVSGHTRFEICKELGIECPVQVVHFADEAVKIRCAFLFQRGGTTARPVAL